MQETTTKAEPPLMIYIMGRYSPFDSCLEITEHRSWIKPSPYHHLTTRPRWLPLPGLSCFRSLKLGQTALEAMLCPPSCQANSSFGPESL